MLNREGFLLYFYILSQSCRKKYFILPNRVIAEAQAMTWVSLVIINVPRDFINY